MVGFFIILSHTFGLISSLHALTSARTSLGTIAWVIVLNTFPYISITAYQILGRSRFQGYVKARRASAQSTAHLMKLFEETLAPYRLPREAIAPAAYAVERLADMLFLKGN